MTPPNSFAAQQVPGASGQQRPPLPAITELEHRQALELLRQVHDSLNPQASRQHILSEPIPFFNGKLVPGWFLVMLGFMFWLIPAVIIISLYPRRFTDKLQKKRRFRTILVQAYFPVFGISQDMLPASFGL